MYVRREILRLIEHAVDVQQRRGTVGFLTGASVEIIDATRCVGA
jgi:hypothetical protein